MRVIIAGDRNETELSLVRRAVVAATRAGVVQGITEVVSGGARGVDTLGEVWAYRANLPCTVFSADWARYGRGAGPIRNAAMAAYADALIAIHRDLAHSKGTRNMIAQARKAGLPVFVYEGEGCHDAEAGGG